MYFDGLGVTQDYSEAVIWIHKAAEQGFAEAQRYLGVMYILGKGINRNYDKGVYWLRMAARQGHSNAQLALKQLGESW